MTVTYEEARREAEDATDCAGGSREDDEIVAVSVGTLLALLSGPTELREPVAWRVKDFADGWILCHTEAQARREAEGCGNLVQPLYASPVPATEPREEEVARVIYEASPARELFPNERTITWAEAVADPTDDLTCGRVECARRDARAVQQLYRSHRDGR